MGMDVYGRKPDSEVGNYFRASVWGWYPILDLIAETGIFTDEQIEEMGTNMGAGPEDAETAIRLADALEGLIAGVRSDGEYIATSDRTTRGTAMVAIGIMDMLNGADMRSSVDAPIFSCDVGFVKEFIEFCRHSGGFQIH